MSIQLNLNDDDIRSPKIELVGEDELKLFLCHGEEFATKHYSKYKRFDPEWKKLNRKGELLDE